MGFQISSGGLTANTLSVPGGWAILEDDGIVEANPETGPVATVKFKVYNAADRYSFVQQLLGQWVGIPPTNIVYTGPYLYPPAPYLFCTAVTDMRGFDKPLPIAGLGIPWLFKKSAIVTAVFTRPPWQPLTSGGYFSVSYSGGGEFFTVPETTYRFADGTPTNTPVGILIPEGQITVARYRMPFIPDQVTAPIYGAVNDQPFWIGWNQYPEGTLLFSGMDTQIEGSPLGAITYQVAYKFLYRQVPWNYDFHPDRTTGFAPITDGNGAGPYPVTSFEVLL